MWSGNCGIVTVSDLRSHTGTASESCSVGKHDARDAPTNVNPILH